jgi:hypothetical protein
MEGAASPYAPGTIGDEPSAPRPPERPALFVGASTLLALTGPGLLFLGWTKLLVVTDTVAEDSWPFHVLALAPAALSLLWGLLSDRWPILDTRREGHVLLAALLTAGGWVALQVWHSGPLRVMAACGIIAAGTIASVAIGGALVEIGRRQGTTGRLAAAWIGSVVVAELAEIPFAALVGRAPTPLKIGLCAGLAAIVAISIVVSLTTDPAPPPPAGVHPPLRAYLRTRALWASALLLALAAIAHVPNGAIASGAWPRHLLAATLAGQLVGAVVYAFACRRMPLGRSTGIAFMLTALLTIGLARAAEQTGAVMTLAVVILGLVDGFKFAALSDLTLRASPPGHEAFISALLCAAIAGWEGQRLIEDAFDLSVPAMTAVAAVAAVTAMLTLRTLPASLVGWREGDSAPS